MKLWLISQCVHCGYDSYDSAVVAAETEDDARRTPPSAWCRWDDRTGAWADYPEQVKVNFLGDAAPGIEAGPICASYNAG